MANVDLPIEFKERLEKSFLGPVFGYAFLLKKAHFNDLA
jgi:hypothetical protein